MDTSNISNDPADWLRGYWLVSTGLPGEPSISFENVYGRTARLGFNTSCFPFDAADISPLIGQTVTAVTKETDGYLTIVFESGEAIWITGDNEFEPWEIRGDLGQLMVCMAGGELAIWGRSRALRSGKRPPVRR